MNIQDASTQTATNVRTATSGLKSTGIATLRCAAGPAPQAPATSAKQQTELPPTPWAGKFNTTDVKVDPWHGGKNDCLEHILLNQGFTRAQIYEKKDGKSLIDEVAKANKLSDPNLVGVGQKLVIPSNLKPAATPPQAHGDTTAQTGPHSPSPAPGNAAASEPHHPAPGTAAAAFDEVGQGVSTLGKGVSDLGQGAQHGVTEGVNWIDHKTDNALDAFKHSTIGNNVVGHGVADAADATVHFAGGIVKGVSGLVTGLVGLAGGVVRAGGDAVQYASDAKYRQETNQAVSRFAEGVEKNPTAIPKAIGHSIAQAWNRDHADFLGQATGMIGATILTAGAAPAAGMAGEATETTAAAAETATAATTSELAEGTTETGALADAATERTAAATATATEPTASATDTTAAVREAGSAPAARGEAEASQPAARGEAAAGGTSMVELQSRAYQAHVAVADASQKLSWTQRLHLSMIDSDVRTRAEFSQFIGRPYDIDAELLKENTAWATRRAASSQDVNLQNYARSLQELGSAQEALRNTTM